MPGDNIPKYPVDWIQFNVQSKEPEWDTTWVETQNQSYIFLYQLLPRIIGVAQNVQIIKGELYKRNP